MGCFTHGRREDKLSEKMLLIDEAKELTVSGFTPDGAAFRVDLSYAEHAGKREQLPDDLSMELKRDVTAHDSFKSYVVADTIYVPRSLPLQTQPCRKNFPPGSTKRARKRQPIFWTFAETAAEATATRLRFCSILLRRRIWEPGPSTSSMSTRRRSQRRLQSKTILKSSNSMPGRNSTIWTDWTCMRTDTFFPTMKACPRPSLQKQRQRKHRTQTSARSLLPF